MAIEYSPSEFIDMLNKQTQPSHVYLSQHPIPFYHLHVFRSSMEGGCIQKFTSILLKLRNSVFRNYLVQFWVPIKIEDKCFLRTSNQPFALASLFKGEFCEYRLHSMGREFCVDDDCEENQLGVPGRVFRNLTPEFSPDVSYYDIKEYPQLDFSLDCGVQESYVAPLIESSTRRCVGVVEFVSALEYDIMGVIFEFQKAEENENLEVFGLRCTEIPRKLDEVVVGGEIRKMMEAVEDTYGLPGCMIWAPCYHSRVVANNNSIGPCFDYLSPYFLWFDDDDDDYDLNSLKKMCGRTHIRKGNTVVGRVFTCYKPCYCPDLAQSSISEYPLLHCARYFKLNSSFAIYIRGNNDCVLEFFLPREIEGDPLSLIQSMLAMIGKQLPKDYKVANGEGTFVDFPVEAVMSNMVTVNSRDQPLRGEVMDLGNKHNGVLGLSEGEGRGTTMEDQPLMEVINAIATTMPVERFDVGGQYSSSEFMHILDKQAKISHVCVSPPAGHLHVFRSNKGQYRKITKKFTSILKGLSRAVQNCLIQFWIPIKNGDKRFLATIDQPFCLSKLHKGLCQYRLHSMGYKFCADDDCEENQPSVPGRVFRHLMPELSPDVSYYAVKEYPQLDFSLQCGVRESYVFPLRQYSTRQCVGVVEFVCTIGPIIDVIDEFQKVAESENLEVFGLRCSESRIPTMPNQGVIVDEIMKMITEVGKTYRLPICQIWASCNRFVYFDDDDDDDFFLDNCYWIDHDLDSFHRLCENTHMRMGKGVAGRTILVDKPYYWLDLAQFSIFEYPLLHCARKYGLNSCFAINIKSFYKWKKLVLKFFLPRENADDPRSLMKSILATIEEQLPIDYKVSIGEGTFVDFSVEAVMSNMVNANSRDQPLTVEVIELENENNGVLNRSEGECHGTTMEDQPLMVGIDVIATPSEGEGRGTTMEDQPLTVEVVDLGNKNNGVLSLSGGEGRGTTMDDLATPSERDQTAASVSVVNQLADKEDIAAVTSTTEEKEQIRGTIPCSKENLKKYIGIGIKRHDAAKIFGVSVPTFKRRCREYGIERWNSPNRRNNKSSIDAADKKIDENDQTNEGPCVEPPPIDIEEASTSIATVKAMYKSDIVKFRLSSSPGVAEVGREVTKRFNLKEGSFKIKYKDKQGDWILIVCDEDLQECITEHRSVGVGTPINMRIELKKTR